jgi:YHS domain-containing protein
MDGGSATDPVCGKQVDALRARAIGIFGGVTYYFCSPECKAGFADPRRAPRGADAATPAAPAPRREAAAAAPASRPPTAPAVQPVVAQVAPTATGDAPPSISRAPERAQANPERPLADRDLAPSSAVRQTTDRVEAIPESRVGGAPRIWLVVAVVLGTVVVGAVGLRARSTPAEAPAAPSMPSPKAEPAQAERPSATSPPEAPDKSVAAAAPSVTGATDKGVAGFQPPLKIGARRFIEEIGGQSMVVVRLVVIDATGRFSISELARHELPAEARAGVELAALQPKDDFAATTVQTGVIFEDLVELGTQRLAVRISRQAESLVGETRISPTDSAAAAEDRPWRTTVTIPLPAGTRLRGAGFAKNRYQPAAAGER